MKARMALAFLLLSALGAVAYQAHNAARPAGPPSLAAFVPQGALLTIESPDFASLLQQWTSSPEKKAWLASSNYAVFQNSRLFGRLGDAQSIFATAAGIPGGFGLLHQVAGKQSIFAWYDIGKLEFLYITRMSAEQANQTQLLQARGGFQRRHAGNADFYVRNSGADYSTVAFAQVSTPSGDLLLLATREDLVANALTQLASTSPVNSIQQEPWFQDATAALPPEAPAPALHMVMNLDRIAVDPHFRSYWVQQNITWMRQFRAGVSDLYPEAAHFREERVLLPQSPQSSTGATTDVTSLAALAPASAGVFRAIATQDPSIGVTDIQEKLLGANTSSSKSEDAPDPNLDVPQAGVATELETRIDVTPRVSSTASNQGIARLLQSSGLNAVLTLSSAQMPARPGSPWVAIHSAVVLRTANAVGLQGLADALEQCLAGPLTTSNIGIDFQPVTIGGNTLYSLTGPRPFFFAMLSTPARGHLMLLADDQSLLLELLQKASDASAAKQPAVPAEAIAAFNHASQRGPYRLITSLIDGANNQAPANSTANVDAHPPMFFSGNIRSLSDTFATLQSERVVEHTLGSNLRQTVTYTWATP